MGRRSAGARRGRDRLACHHRPELVRSIHRAAPDHALRDALRAPRCPRPPAARAEDGQFAGGVVDGESRWAPVRVQAAPGPQVPQRRSRHDGGREVQLRAVQGRRIKGAESPCAPGGDRRSPDHPLPPEGGLARLHDVLRNDRHRGGARRPQEVPHPGRGRGVRQASHRRGPLSIRQPQARGSKSCSRRIPGTGATHPTSSG